MLTSWVGAPLPVTAELDAQGRLTELSANLPTLDNGYDAPAGRLTIKITSYGAAVTPLPRPTATTEARPLSSGRTEPGPVD
jgi:hypothetical protein